MNDILLIFIVVLCVLLIDIAWLTLMKPMYESLVRRVQKAPLHVNTYGAIASYIIVIALLVMYAFPQALDAVQNKKYTIITASIRFGGVLGLLSYGMFNATNYAIFEYYSLKSAIVDTIWGTTIFTIAVYLYLAGQR